MEEKKEFKKISLEELDNISGGEIIEVDGMDFEPFGLIQ